jgi:predicted permease
MKSGRWRRSALWRGPVEEEVDAELEFHVEMRARELVGRGMDPDRAREEAIRRFGNINRVIAACRDIGRRRNRDMRRIEYLSELRQDVTFSVRQLLDNPGFAAVAVLTLALGIGATATIFSAVRAVVLRPLPFPQPEQIFAIYESWREVQGGNVSAGNFTDAAAANTAFSAMTAIQYSSFNFADATGAERVIGARTTASFWDVFGTRPEFGRVFGPAEDQPGREQVVVLSNRLWRQRFAGDRSILGRQVRLSGRPHEVIGVMPASFDFTDQTEQLWVPLALTPERKANHDEHNLTVYARLHDQGTPEQARAELVRTAEQLRTNFPRDNAERGLTMTPMMTELVGDNPRRLFVLLGAVGFVLLIACGNIANLLLARGAARGGELAVRSALGAGRARIVRQLLTESIVLGQVAAAAGIALAWWGIRTLVAAAPAGIMPRLEQTTVDPAVLGFTLLISLVCAFIFGLAPALRAGRGDLVAILKTGGRSAAMGGVRDRLRTVLIAGQLALAVVLLVGAGLMIRSGIALQRVDPGFDYRGVFTGRIALPADDYADPARVVATLERLREEAGRVSGVQAVAITSQVPMGPGGNSNGLIPEGRPIEARSAIDTRLRIVSPGYFETMGIPIVRGRPLTDADRRGSLKVMVISEALANAAFPGADPIGRRIACCEPGPDGKSPDFKVVVGVAGNVRSRGLGESPAPEFYLPMGQVPPQAWNWIQRTVYVAARTSLDPALLSTPLRQVVSSIAPDVALFNERTMEERLELTLGAARFNTLLLAILGAIGVVLAAVGIYGVIAYFVTRRTQEIGVRMALGATRRDVVRLIVRQAAIPILAGLAIGLVVALASTRVLNAQLFDVSANDPLTFVIVAAGLAVIGLIASFVPATRAAGMDPTRALHTS